jgi:hypothetical protein
LENRRVSAQKLLQFGAIREAELFVVRGQLFLLRRPSSVVQTPWFV